MTTPTRTLVLMRHSEAATGGPDHDRPLTEQGLADSRAAGRWLARQVGEIDLVVLSDAVRTRQTWEAAVEGGAIARQVRATETIYEASLDHLLAEVAHLPDEATTVLMLGHAPGMPMLVNTLASSDSPVAVAEALDQGFPTTTVCVLEADREWLSVGAATADLVAVEVPRA
ncbi:SixA phosphatase family protein [Arsenicicoccus dermatophilus]|uniref:SixA phosphatase family protein n=1 Tax=Arsenicicoccus dermatophilus TaxID=1076331 RepID=UPI00391724ED